MTTLRKLWILLLFMFSHDEPVIPLSNNSHPMLLMQTDAMENIFPEMLDSVERKWNQFVVGMLFITMATTMSMTTAADDKIAAKNSFDFVWRCKISFHIQQKFKNETPKKWCLNDSNAKYFSTNPNILKIEEKGVLQLYEAEIHPNLINFGF